MKSIIKTNQPEVGHGIAIFDPTTNKANSCSFLWAEQVNSDYWLLENVIIKASSLLLCLSTVLKVTELRIISESRGACLYRMVLEHV